MKLLFWLLLGFLVYLALRKKGSAQGKGYEQSGPQPSAGAAETRPRAGSPEAMLQCRQCGVHFPASEAVHDPFGAVFCSEDHLRLFNTEKTSR
jgi:uncharacterized protein